MMLYLMKSWNITEHNRKMDLILLMVHSEFKNLRVAPVSAQTETGDVNFVSFGF